MLVCILIFLVFLLIFYFSSLYFNMNTIFSYFIILIILAIFFSNSFVLSLNNLFFKYINISYFVIFSNFNFLFSLVVLLVCILLLCFILFYFRWFYFILWFILVFFVFFFSITSYVVSFNFIFTFLFWEMMGMCWFFLISSFYYRNKTRFASFIAFFWNVIGDFTLLLYVIVSIVLFWSLSLVYNYVFYISCFFLVLAIIAKSAVFPMQTWLYYAMEGPTPVSAFLHAAWMITAGVYLFFVLPFFLNSLLYLLPLFSILMFSINAIFYFDLKKIIASWTGSQMGYILLFLSSNFILNGLLLFWYHAVFKSYFFFLAGILISSYCDYQDYRIQQWNFLWFFFLFFCWLGLIGLFFFWTGVIKEIFVFKFLSLSLIKFSFFFIFIFWCIYSFKLFIMYYRPIIFNKERIYIITWCTMIIIWEYSFVLFADIWTNEPLYYFGLYHTFIYVLFFLPLFIDRVEFYNIVLDLCNWVIFSLLMRVFTFLFFTLYYIYNFCNFYFTFY